MERSRWMTNGVVTRRVNGVKNEAQLRAMGFVECAEPEQARTERIGRDLFYRPRKYAGR